MSENLSCKNNLARRVENLALGPTTPSNALVPVFEALYNAVHATQARFGDAWSEQCSIRIQMTRDDDNISFAISDNGIGLNQENFDSFREFDSPYKREINGKGVGRLSWFKVFDTIHVESTFADPENCIFKRSFDFEIDNDTPVKNHSIGPGSASEIGTTIYLANMKRAYAEHCPRKISTIQNKVIAHFAPILLSVDTASIEFCDEDACTNLRDFVDSLRLRADSGTFSVKSYDDLTIRHSLVDRSLADEGPIHKICFAAHGRIVREVKINEAVGLPTFIEFEGRKSFYIGIVESEKLGKTVNSERTNFDIDPEDFRLIHERAIVEARAFLEAPINRLIKRQGELVRAVVNTYPRYSYIVGNPEDFARNKLPLNARSPEQIYQQLSIHDFRENRRIGRKFEQTIKGLDADKINDEVERALQEVIKRVTEQERSALADYVARRKIIIDLLEKRMGRPNARSSEHYTEEAVHKVVCPMRVTSDDVDVEEHNMWLLDDKLAYYEFWASDKRMKDFALGSDSKDRPDLVLFEGQLLFQRPDANQPVVIVEFKRPARGGYDYEENPIVQIYEYIEELRHKKVNDRQGALITSVDETTPFFCYIVADITDNLRKYAKFSQITGVIPGGGGLFGYNEDYKAFIQILNYQYVIRDARLRNEVFFKQLKL